MNIMKASNLNCYLSFHPILTQKYRAFCRLLKKPKSLTMRMYGFSPRHVWQRIGKSWREKTLTIRTTNVQTLDKYHIKIKEDYIERNYKSSVPINARETIKKRLLKNMINIFCVPQKLWHWYIYVRQNNKYNIIQRNIYIVVIQ